MSLEYKILWIDDQTDDIRYQIDLIKDFVTGEGLTPKVVEAKTTADIDRRVNALTTAHGSFDLIVVDYHLADGRSGATTARDIRIKTSADVIFYSSDTKQILLQQLHNHSVDGVFVANRREITHRVREIISAHIRWAVNITAMRGISTSAVSDIDCLIKDLIAELGMHAKWDAPTLAKQLFDHLKENHDAQQGSFEKVASFQTLEDFADDPRFSSDVRFKFLKKIWGALPENPAISRLRENVSRYDEKILVHRNTLAHGRTQNDTIVLGKNRSLSSSDLKDLRILIRDHHGHFQALVDQLKSLRPNIAAAATVTAAQATAAPQVAATQSRPASDF